MSPSPMLGWDFGVMQLSLWHPGSWKCIDLSNRIWVGLLPWFWGHKAFLYIQVTTENQPIVV